MKTKKILVLIAVCLAVAFLSAPVTSFAEGSTPVQAVEPDKNQVLATRFLNMLNHNNAYNEAFMTEEALVNSAVISQLSLRDEQNEDYIKEEYIKDFVYNMYGIEILDFSQINARFPQTPGFVYIIPKGYETYSHEFLSMSENEDGTVSVHTSVTVTCHDNTTETFEAVTLFVENANSHYGYNIVHSNIITDIEMA